MEENDTVNTGNNAELEPEHKRKVFIGSLSYQVDEDAFRNYWTQYGTVLNATILRDRDGRSRGFGFVTFDSSAGVDAVMKARPHKIDNRVIEPKRAIPRESSHRQDSQTAMKKLYVGGVKEPITEQDLKDYFSRYGNIINATVTKDRDGQYRGYGFVEFDDYDPVDKIILDKDHYICGLQLTVQKAQSKENTSQRSGGNMRSRPGPPSRGRSSFSGGFNNRQRGSFDGSYGRGSNNNDFTGGYNSNFNQGDTNRASFGQGYNQQDPSGPMRRGNMQGRGGGRGYAPYNPRGRNYGGYGGDGDNSTNNQGASWTSWD